MVTKNAIGLFSDRMHPIRQNGNSEASDEGHFVHFVNSVRNRSVTLLAADTAASTFNDEEIAFHFTVEFRDRAWIAGANRAGKNTAHRQIAGRGEET